jgi:predicted N-acetyltransferase YhbS
MTATIPTITIRSIRLEDVDRLSEICYTAFNGISDAHNFPRDFPSAEMTHGFMGFLATTPYVHSFVAERDGKLLGSSFLWPGTEVAGVGPVTVDAEEQGSAVGRLAMEATVAKSDEIGQRSVRLVQAAFNRTSMALYAKLGFEVKEPLVCMQGSPIGITVPGHIVRLATEADIPAAEAVCRQVHGHDRTGEFASAVEKGVAKVVEKDGQIVGYTTDTGFFGHTVGLTNEAVFAILGAAESFSGPGILLPSRNSELFRWALAHGLKITQPMTLMSRGWYQEPKGAFLPSILF